MPGTTRRDPTPTAVPTTRSGSPARWWMAVALGAIVSMPLAWLLSYAAMLPFFIGLFFFALFGLIIGAVMHRVASPGRPYNRTALVVGTTMIVAAGWIASIVKESRDFPGDMAVETANRTRDIGDRSVEEYRAAVADEIRHFLRKHYPPGGTFGYIRWVVTSGELKKGQIENVSRTLRRSQRKSWWAIRVILSIALFGFGIGSQTLPLRLASEPAVRAINEK